ncbi:MAG: ferrochelatase [Flavobacteriales bacterium]|nr:ferrochelatase [Flavobacteriales bacterium]
MNKKTAILLINLGSPDSPKPGDVFRYLTEFLNDPRVIDLPWVSRKILVNAIIVPFRYRKSARLYAQLWNANGSPLIHYGKQVRELLEKKIANPWTKVFLAMRYQNPSLENVMTEIRKWNPSHLIVLPLFPQYASASTGSALEKVFRLLKQWHVIPDVKIISQFYNHPKFIECWVDRAQRFDLASYDHVLFSFHGLPERHLDKIYEDGLCSNHPCETEINDENEFCYKATCYATARLIASRIGLSNDQYTVCFQSRLGKGWIEPFSDAVIENLAEKRMKKLLVFSPSFIADCLETTVEIGEEYLELFRRHGGEELHLVESLNDHPMWIDALAEIALT